MSGFYGKYSGIFGGGGGGGITYTFIDSLLSNAGTVSLVNDSAAPGASKYYGTDSGGILGYFTLPAVTAGNFTDVGTDGITITGGTGAVLGTGTTISQHVADATHNGYLSSTDWGTFNGKQSALTLGNLTDAGTDGITITGGTGAVVGTGAAISQHVADATHNGYLSSADWSTFNGKGSGTVTTVSVASANGFAGTVATATTTPAITISTTITGLLKGNGTAVSAAVASTDYIGPTTGSAIQKASSGGLTAAVAGTDYQVPITAGDVTTSGATATIGANKVVNSMLAQMANGTIKSNISGSTGNPADNSLTAIIDSAFSSTQGSILYRGASAWLALGPGSSGQVLQSGGAAANPSWVSGAAGPVVALSYYASANRSIDASTNANYDTRIFDTASGTTYSAGVFTAPATGYYHISFVSLATSGSVSLVVYKNGSAYSRLGAVNSTTTGSGGMTIQLNSGDTASVRASGSITLDGSSSLLNRLDIFQVK